jgi:hypothetical protein
MVATRSVITVPISSSDPCRKMRFRDREEAHDVLRHIQNQRHHAEIDGVETRRHEVRCYECDRCHGVHLTSRPA